MRTRTLLPVVAVTLMSIGIGASAKRVTITFGSSKGPDEIKIYQRLISEFEKQNPGIKVKIDLYSGDFREKLLLNFVVGNAPDCFETGLEDFPLYPKSGYLMELDKFVDKNDLKDFPKQLTKTFSSKGHLFALTRDIAPLVMLYNTRMFSQAGVPPPDDTWTWDAYATILARFSKDTNGDGRPDTYGFAGAPWETFVWQAGGDIYDDEVNPRKLTLGTQESLAGLQFAADLKNKYGISSNPSAGDVSTLASGKAATVIGGYWERVYNLKASKQPWDAAPVPSGKVRATTMYTASYSVNRVSKHPIEAFKWVAFVTGTQGQREMAKSGLAVPSRMSIAREVIPNSTPPANGEAFLKALDYGRLAYQFGFRKPTAEVTAGLATLWSGKASAAQAVAKMEKAVNTLLGRIR